MMPMSLAGIDLAERTK